VAKEGLKTVLGLLQKGRAVLLFPEGNRTADGTISPLKPGVLLLIKRTLAPIVPVGIAGAFNLFPRQQKLPGFAPLFLPAPRGGIAVSIGPALDGRRYAELPREEALAELFDRIQAAQQRAERLRRKA
jgi:1-acyl-sn-glycerol-3-phosphate acyltransferase